MVSSTSLPWARIAVQALVAGIAGDACFNLFLWLTKSPEYAAASLAVRAIVGIGWAGGYAYFAATRPATNARWPIAGAAYGIVVYVLTQLILLGSGLFTPPPSPNAFVIAVAAHTLFFGVPVAYAVKLAQSRGLA